MDRVVERVIGLEIHVVSRVLLVECHDVSRETLCFKSLL